MQAAGDNATVKLNYLLNTSGADNNINYVLPTVSKTCICVFEESISLDALLLQIYTVHCEEYKYFRS